MIREKYLAEAIVEAEVLTAVVMAADDYFDKDIEDGDDLMDKRR